MEWSGKYLPLYIDSKLCKNKKHSNAQYTFTEEMAVNK